MTLEAAALPAITAEPKLLIVACTITEPTYTIDCCKADGNANFNIISNNVPSNHFSPSVLGNPANSLGISFIANTIARSWEIAVAAAAPATPQWNQIINTKSNITLIIDEKIKNFNGVFEFPRALYTLLNEL